MTVRSTEEMQPPADPGEIYYLLGMGGRLDEGAERGVFPLFDPEEIPA
jgi:hypothetical protein